MCGSTSSLLFSVYLHIYILYRNKTVDLCVSKWLIDQIKTRREEEKKQKEKEAEEAEKVYLRAMFCFIIL